MISIFELMDKLTEELDNHMVILQRKDNVYMIQISTFVGGNQCGVQYNMTVEEVPQAREIDAFMEVKLNEIIKKIHLSVVSEIPHDGNAPRLYS